MKAKKLIYVVDDNAFNLLMLTTRLKRVTNCKVKEFNSADQCLLAVEKEKPDLVVSDYNLKHGDHHMNGNHLLHIIKKSNPDIPVIIYSSSENPDMAAELVHEKASEIVLGHKRFLVRLANAVKNEINKMNNEYEFIRGKRLLISIIILLSTMLYAIYQFDESYFKHFIIIFISALVILLFFNKQFNELLHRL